MFVIPAPNPIAFQLFGIPIYKYGIVIAFAIFVAMLIANKLYNVKISNEKKDVIIEYAPLVIIMGILCARLYFCILSPGYYFSHPLEILDIRQGGLSIHGAILGGILSMFFVSQKLRISFLLLMDSLAGGTFIGQAIGRWGNYFNSEAFGYPIKSQNWGLFIPESLRPVQYSNFSLFHPTFLYESCLDLCAFIILLYLISALPKRTNGIVFCVYLILYSLIRFSVEWIRVDSAFNIGSVPIAIIVSGILFSIGICGCVYILKQKI